MPAGQKRAPDLIIDGCKPPCGGWELNSGSLEEQAIRAEVKKPLSHLSSPLKSSFNLSFIPEGL